MLTEIIVVYRIRVKLEFPRLSGLLIPIICPHKEIYMTKKKRREYTKEFKADAVALVKQAEIDSGKGTEGALITMEREELKRLRKQNKRLLMEREIRKRTASSAV